MEKVTAVYAVAQWRLLTLPFFGIGFPFKVNQPKMAADALFPMEIHRAFEAFVLVAKHWI